MKIQLRDYQQKIFEDTQSAFRQGYRRPLIVSPCGSGKSYIFASMANAVANGEVLILTHRHELFQQHSELLDNHNISARISMILTEANRLGKYEKPALIILDEAHLSRSNSWVKVINYYDTFCIGFTGTPIRLDGKPLGDIYDTLINGPSVKSLIREHRLSPFKYFAPVSVDTDDLRLQAGDYVTGDIEKLMMDRVIYSDVLKSYKKLADGKKTITYCVSRKHAKETAELFASAGYKTAAIDSTTPMTERERVMNDFRDGNITMLCNVGIISEGVSIDDVECCLLLRPTASHALYWQQSMRCMRYQPKKTAIIIDCVANYTRNPMPDDDVEWSLEKKLEKPKRFNPEGCFYVRTCPECFRVFKNSLDTCPYCGAPYPLQIKELKAKKDIELQQINEQQKKAAEAYRKQRRREVGMCRTFPELVALAKSRGYKNPQYYAIQVLKGRTRA